MFRTLVRPGGRCVLPRTIPRAVPQVWATNTNLVQFRQFNALFSNALEELTDEDDKKKGGDDKENNWKSIFIKSCETIAITFSSIAMLGIAGLMYHKFYAKHVLDKMDDAFEKGDPAAIIKMHTKTSTKDDENSDNWVVRAPQQALLDDIILGKTTGRYFLIVGEKGTGKTSLILEAMKKVDGYNVAMFDAHADPEIFRIRLGKALNFTYSEDYIGSLFSIRGPRDTTALLDIERAFSKLEELAIIRAAKLNKPLVMIINNAHLIKENEEGIKLLELLQQKAESLSGSGLVTMVFNSDDYWVYEKLKKLGTKLELINVRDFNRQETLSALTYIRNRFLPHHPITETQCHQIYDLIGGRAQHISQVAQHKDIFKACHEIIDREKTWFLNQCGLLGMNMDDDVMESGKFSSSAMLLMKEFVDMDRASKNPIMIPVEEIVDSPPDVYPDHSLPALPLWRARQIMTRADYIQQYDNLNIFTLDSHSHVRPDSIPMMRAFHEIALQPHFDELLEDTIQRVADIEALGRTREIVLKDLNLGSKYVFSKSKDESKKQYQMLVIKSQKQVDLHGDFPDSNEDDDESALLLEDIAKANPAKLWQSRLTPVYPQKESQNEK